MYLPNTFEVTDLEALHGLIRNNALGTWVTLGESGLVVNHIPFILDLTRGEHGVLMGHVAKANPVWREFSKTMESVVAFQGPQAYITPAWYASKAVDGKVVPTWNYAAVHVQGMPRVVEDREAFLTLLSRLTDTFEENLPHPWRVSDAPADYIDKTMNAIVGIEIPVSKIEGKWKVNQNRSDADKQSVAEGLQQQGESQALAMRELVVQYGKLES